MTTAPLRYILRTNGTIEPLDKPTPLRELARLIGAATLDTVNLRNAEGQVMLVDDIGYEARKRVNPLATKLYHAVSGSTHLIVGDVAVVPDQDFA